MNAMSSTHYTPAALRPHVAETVSSLPAHSLNEADATVAQLRFLKALGLPVPEAVTVGRAHKITAEALAAGRVVVDHDAWGDGPPSPGTVGSLATYGLAAPATWSAASRLLSACRADGRPQTRCSRGTHARDEHHGRLRATGGWLCTSCHQGRQSEKSVAP